MWWLWREWGKFSVVTLMTLARIIGAGVVVALLHVGVFEYALAVFIAAALLDLDGYCARAWKVTTKFGAFLDPLADKVLLLTAIYGLYVSGVLWNEKNFTWSLLLVIPSVVMVAREVGTLGVSIYGLLGQFRRKKATFFRDLFIFGDAHAHTRPPSTEMGKWKMVVQCVSVCVLMGAACAVDYHAWWVSLVGATLWISGGILYWLAGYFTFVTGLDYLGEIVPKWKEPIRGFLRQCWIPASLS